MSSCDCSKDFDRDFLKNHLQALASSLGIEKPEYRVSLASEKGENFIGIVYRVCVWEYGSENERHWFVFKAPPNNELQRLLLQTAQMFQTEIFFYDNIVPLFKEILKKCERTLDFVPICHRTSLREHEEIIILEDLKQQGFVHRDRLDQFDYSHASTVLRYLGRMHAISFALRDQRPEIMETFGKIRENIFNRNVLSNEHFHYRVDLQAESARTALSDEEPKYLARFDMFYKSVWNDLEKACMPKAAEPYSVITHGDPWSNNILFKYKKDSKEIEDVRFIDFQIARFASPAFDIHYMIYTCTNQELRDEYYDHLIRDYYDSLFEYLIEIGSDPNTLFPLEVLREHLKTYGFFAGATAILLLHLVTSNSENPMEITESKSDVEMLKKRVISDTHYRVTLRDAFKDMIDRNYI